MMQKLSFLKTLLVVLIITISTAAWSQTSSSFTANSCGEYTVPSGDETHYTSGVYMDTIPNVAGFDSVMTIIVTINPLSTTIDTQIACGSYEWIDGVTYSANNTTTTFTETNIAGCDSIITLDLTIDICVGVSDLELSEISIYPNPTNGIFTISSDENYNYDIFDITGRVILNGRLENTINKVDISNKSKDIYFIRLNNEHRNKVIKLIKQ